MLEFGTRLANVEYLERPGAYAIIRNAGDDVAVVRTSRGCFLPGGGVDPGEDLILALKREIVEETGFDCAILGEAGTAAQYLANTRNGIFYKKVGHFFRASLGEKVTDETEPDHELLWLAPAEACRVLAHAFQSWAVRQVCKI